MKNYLLFLMFLFPLNALCQEEKTVQLNEVTVKAAKVIEQADGKLIIPSITEKQAATNGYTLLNKLPLPNIDIDPVLHTVSTNTNQGTVQIRINGAICSKEDMLALNPKRVKSIEYINNPGLRYGKDIAYVINIKTTRNNEGYTIGADLSNTLTSWYGDNLVFSKWNHKNSEFGVSYNFNYQDNKGYTCKETSDYLLSNGTHYTINREELNKRIRNFGNTLELKYNLADSSSYVFQTTFTLDFNNKPGNSSTTLFSESGQEALETYQWRKSKSKSPILDLYFYHQLGKHQSITANMVGTAILTNTYNFNNEGSDYAYSVDGKTYSLTSEAIYENRLKPVSLSAGLQHRLKYTSNKYMGDVNSVNNMHNQSLYLFGEVKGKLQKLNYSAGLGVSNEQYQQSTNKFSYWLFRPKATLAYSLFDAWNLRYTFELSQHISQIAMISDTRIRVNSLEWTVGNPNIKPNGCIEHSIAISFSKPRFSNQLNTAYRNIRNCNMESYSRSDDNQFYYTQKNQKGIKMFYVMNYTNWSIIPDKLDLNIGTNLFRIINKGDNYIHTITSYQLNANLQAYLGKWTLMAYFDSGYKFMEGERWNHESATTYFSCSYQLGNCNISIYAQHPFQKNPRTDKGGVDNALIHRLAIDHCKDYGNRISLNISWKINKGKQFRNINRKLNNKDTQTGILK